MEQLCKSIAQQSSMIEKGQKSQLSIVSIALGEEEIQYLVKNIPSNIRQFKLNKNSLSPTPFSLLTQLKWSNLIHLDLSYNLLGDKGCKLVTQGSWTNIEKLWLFDNNISEYGTLHLSKGNWKRLSLLHLSNNKIGNGFENLVKGNWKVLQRLFVKSNRANFTHLSKIVKGDWPNLMTLWLIYNQMDNEENNLANTIMIKRFNKLTQLIIW